MALDDTSECLQVGRSFAAGHCFRANGTLHVLWWDPLEGEQYARTTGVTSTTWTKPVGVEPIVGKREVNKETNKVTLTAPHGLRLLSDARGTVHGFLV